MLPCPLGIWVSEAQSNNPRQQTFSLCSDFCLANDAFAFSCNLDSAVLLAAGSFHFSPPAGEKRLLRWPPSCLARRFRHIVSADGGQPPNFICLSSRRTARPATDNRYSLKHSHNRRGLKSKLNLTLPSSINVTCLCVGGHGGQSVLLLYY